MSFFGRSALYRCDKITDVAALGALGNCTALKAVDIDLEWSASLSATLLPRPDRLREM